LRTAVRKITVTRKNVKIISTVMPAITLLFNSSLGPPCVPKFTLAPISGKIALSENAATTAPINWKIMYPIPSATLIFFVIIIGIVTAGLIWAPDM